MNTLVRCFVLVLAAVIAQNCFAGLPSDYGAVPFDQALIQSKQDRKPVLVVFGEDW